MTYHTLNGLRNFTHRQLKDQADSFAVLILLFHRVEQRTSFFFVDALLNTRVAGDLAVFIDNAEANDLIAIFN